MNFARHLLRRPASASVAALVRPIILPTAVPLRLSPTPIPLVHHIVPRLRQVVQPPQQKRLQSTIGPISGSDPSSSSVREVKPSYDLTFTCRPCGKRSTHNVSKQGYHYGSVLITCPGCHNRHVISDHLKVFSETARSFDEILEQSGSGETISRYTAAQRSYEEQLGAADTLRERGIWSEGGNHVEVLPEGDGADVRPTNEHWETGLDTGGRNVYPDPEEEEEGEEEEELGAQSVGDKAVDSITNGKEDK